MGICREGQVVESLLGRAVDKLVDDLVAELEYNKHMARMHDLQSSDVRS